MKAKPSSLRARLRKLCWHPVFEAFILLLIVASVTLMVAEATLAPGGSSESALEQAATFITAIFAVELGLRWYALGDTRRFLRGYWLDCLAVAPLLRPLRILRVLRLVRLFRAGLMVSRWAARLEGAFARGYREYLVVAMVAATLVLTGSMSILVLEGQENGGVSTFGQAMWWATYTMMAGEPIGAEPQTTGGRLVLLVMMLGGMTVFALLTGTVSAIMVDRLKNTLEANSMQLEELENHIIVCGWNRGGSRLIAELCRERTYADRAVVIVADFPAGEDPQIDFHEIPRERIFLVRDDYTRIHVLEQARIREASLAILLADKLGSRSDQDRDARTVLAALSIEKLHPDIFTCVELLHQENAHPLKLAGVEEIVVASEMSSTIMAHASLNDGLVGLLEEVLTSSYGNTFYKEPMPAAWAGWSFSQAMRALRDEHGAILIAAERRAPDGKGWIQRVNPNDDEPLAAGDRVVYLATGRIGLG